MFGGVDVWIPQEELESVAEEKEVWGGAWPAWPAATATLPRISRRMDGVPDFLYFKYKKKETELFTETQAKRL